MAYTEDIVLSIDIVFSLFLVIPVVYEALEVDVTRSHVLVNEHPRVIWRVQEELK